MFVTQAILVALFCMVVVFFVLIALWVIVRLSGGVICWMEKRVNIKK